MILWLQYALLRLIAAGLARIPLRLNPILFKLLWPCYRRLCKLEVERVSAHMVAAKIKQHSPIDVYRSLFYNGLDSLRYLVRHQATEARVQVVNAQLLHNLLNDQKPIVVVSIHIGAFEMLHRAIANQGYPVSLITSKHSRGAIERFLHKARAVKNLRIVSPSEAPKLLRELIRKKGMVAMMLDQSRTGKGTRVELFSRPTYFWLRLPLEACQEGATIVTVRAIRKGNEHVIKFESAYPGGYDQQQLSQMLASEFESWIRENPEQWTWNYPRLWQLD